MRCACIDVGSNTTRLLVADTVPGGIQEVLVQRVFTLIGQSLGEGAQIPREKLDETAAVVADQAETACLTSCQPCFNGKRMARSSRQRACAAAKA